MLSFVAGMGGKCLRALVVPHRVPLCAHCFLPGLRGHWEAAVGLRGHWEAVVGLWGIS